MGVRHLGRDREKIRAALLSLQVHAPGGGGEEAEADAAAAAEEAWATFGDGSPFAQRFVLAFANAKDAPAVKGMLAGIPKASTGAALGGAIAKVWEAVTGEAAPPAPLEALERATLVAAYNAAYAGAQTTLGALRKKVDAGQLTPLAEAGSKLYLHALDVYDTSTAGSSVAREHVVKRRSRLRKQLASDLKELFDKQLRTLMQQIFESHQAALLKINGRAGQVEQWQRDALQKRAEARWALPFFFLFSFSLTRPTFFPRMALPHGTPARHPSHAPYAFVFAHVSPMPHRCLFSDSTRRSWDFSPQSSPSRYFNSSTHRTHFSHMSHPTFPTSHLLFSVSRLRAAADALAARGRL